MRVVIVGLGVMGLSTARVLAERGHDVIGLDRYGVGALPGSSSGDSRIFRLSHADRDFIRLASRAHDGWRRIEERVGQELINMCGVLERGDAALATAEALAAEGVAFRSLDADGVNELFPELSTRADVPAIFQADAGTIRADRALQVDRELARAAGAEIVEGERVVSVELAADRVRLDTDRRTLDAEVAVICAGPWLGELLASLEVLPSMTPVPVQGTYFHTDPGLPDRPVIFDWYSEETGSLYGMPTGHGYKAGLLDSTTSWDGEAGEVPISADEVELVCERVREAMPGLGEPTGSQACPVTLTGDGKFILDRHDRLVIGGGCSGQAFKFMPLLGEVLSDLVEDRPRDPLMEQFRLGRPGLERPIVSYRDLMLHDTHEATAG